MNFQSRLLGNANLVYLKNRVYITDLFPLFHY